MNAPIAAALLAGPTLTVVSPAYREAANLHALHARLAAVLDGAGVDWEWVVVDDHSPDETFAALEAIAARDPRVRGLRLSRNGGPHAAVATALAHARGEAAVVLAADLQDPPELIPALLARWRDGAQVVWATRRAPPPGPALDRLASRAFHGLMRRIGGLDGAPALGTDFFLLDRVAVDALGTFTERRANLIALVQWMGFRQTRVDYDKAPRAAGRSGWTLARRIELAIDSATAFSVAPIRWISALGALTALGGFAWAAWIVAAALGTGSAPAGWSSLMVAVLLLGGVQMLMMGVLGEYLWRALEESRRRPRALVEAVTGPAAPRRDGTVATAGGEASTRRPTGDAPARTSR
jgi:glycosyltransferase involved in cell wall biosynthesis